MRNSNRSIHRCLSTFALVCALLLFGLPTYAHEEDHIVQPGETLSEIAQQYGTDTETLRVLNNLGDADLVWVGLRLQLPSELDEVVAPADTNADQSGTYTVQSGDTLPAIARAHRISLAHLVTLNRISPAQRLYAGQILVVPSAQSEQSTAVEAEPVAPEANETASARAESNAVESDPSIHIVKAGEHLGIIAAAYEVSALQISQANDLSNASLIVPGQRLIIPPATFEQKAAQAPTDQSGFHVHNEFPTETEKWIDVDLSEQRVVAYDGVEPIKEFIIASGKSGTPTVTGSFRIWAKTPVQDMFGGSRAAGDYYYLEDVQWVQYFFEDYAFHGTYWHTNFGTPQSRGCINMSNEDAKWLYDWSGPYHPDEEGWLLSDRENTGTLVVVHE